MSVRQALADGVERLERAGCASPRVDAELLTQHALSLSRTELFAAPERALGVEEDLRLEQLLDRRCAREPLAYILGEWTFRRVRLRINPDVLVPRPETEILVERCLEHLASQDEPRVLDIGTGSGAIALAIADEHAGARLTATDISARALDVARYNAQRLALDERVRTIDGDLCAGASGPFDLVVSNPPYVSVEEVAGLEPEVGRFEPRIALVGEDFHERIIEAAAPVLSAGGWLLLECGDGQCDEVVALLLERGWSKVGIVSDLAGRARVVEARLGSSRDPGR